jgi:beta-keto acid cleavage enzyme
MAAEPVIISVAITGSVPRKKDNPALPVTTSEQIESTQAAYEAGAALVHVHVRNPDESPSSDPDKFAAFQEGIRKHCPDIIVQFSTGGRGRALEARGAMLHLKPDMASLATGSVNFPTIVYENPPDFVRSLATTMRDGGIKPEIEVFDLAMLYNTADLVKEGLIKPPPHVQFVFGVKHALPARRDMDRRRHRPRSVRGGAMGLGDGRPLPHRPRGQRPPRPEHLGAEQRRTGQAFGRHGRRARPPGRFRQAGARAAGPRARRRECLKEEAPPCCPTASSSRATRLPTRQR